MPTQIKNNDKNSSDQSLDLDNELSDMFGQFVSIDANNENDERYERSEAPINVIEEPANDIFQSFNSNKLNIRSTSETNLKSLNPITTAPAIASAFSGNRAKSHSFSNLNTPSLSSPAAISEISKFSYRNKKESSSSLEMNHISNSQSIASELSDTSYSSDSGSKSLSDSGSSKESADKIIASQNTDISNVATAPNPRKRRDYSNDDSDSELAYNDEIEGFRRKILTKRPKNDASEFTPTGFTELLTVNSRTNTPANTLETIIGSKRPREGNESETPDFALSIKKRMEEAQTLKLFASKY